MKLPISVFVCTGCVCSIRVGVNSFFVTIWYVFVKGVYTRCCLCTGCIYIVYCMCVYTVYCLCTHQYVFFAQGVYTVCWYCTGCIHSMFVVQCVHNMFCLYRVCTHYVVCLYRVCTQYGDLELWLLGMEAGHLIPTFQQHQISLPTFLRMTDVDLTKVIEMKVQINAW